MQNFITHFIICLVLLTRSPQKYLGRLKKGTDGNVIIQKKKKGNAKFCTWGGTPQVLVRRQPAGKQLYRGGTPWMNWTTCPQKSHAALREVLPAGCMLLSIGEASGGHFCAKTNTQIPALKHKKRPKYWARLPWGWSISSLASIEPHSHCRGAEMVSLQRCLPIFTFLMLCSSWNSQ